MGKYIDMQKLICMTLLIFLYKINQAQAGWYSNWSYRRPVSITAGSAATLAYYQVKVNVAYDSDMQANFDDIRFTNSDGTTLIDHWRESYTASTSAVFWVEAPDVISASSSKTIYMYYGKSSVSSASDGVATFDFFDDFSGDLSKWTAVSGTWAIVSGELRSAAADADGTARYIRTSTFQISDGAIDYKAKLGRVGAYDCCLALARFSDINNWYAGGLS